MKCNLKRIAAALEASGDYKILTRLQPSAIIHEDTGQPTLLGMILDCETTGLDPLVDECVEIAILPFKYTADGRIVGIGSPYNQMREPRMPIPLAATRIHGIDDAMVQGLTIDPEEVASFVSNSALIIAHNAAYDRKFIDRFCPSFVGTSWACSMSQAPWSDAGFEGTKLAYLLAGCGWFSTRHRARDDCYATLAILSHSMSHTGMTALAHVLAAAKTETIRIWATGAAFDKKDRLKARSYKWSAGLGDQPKAWFIDVCGSHADIEIAWLRAEIFSPEWMPRTMRITAKERFSDRC